MTTALRNKALAILDGDSTILDVARDVSKALESDGVDGAVIGGIAVVLHGHVRTTRDIDVFCADTAAAGTRLESAGFTFHRTRREFVKDGVPVHLVTLTQVEVAPRTSEERDGIRTVSLADLIDMKLRSGLKHMVRAQDLADVIGLIRARRLGSVFAAKLSKPLRAEFRKLVKAVEKSRE